MNKSVNDKFWKRIARMFYHMCQNRKDAHSDTAEFRFLIVRSRDRILILCLVTKHAVAGSIWRPPWSKHTSAQRFMLQPPPPRKRRRRFQSLKFHKFNKIFSCLLAFLFHKNTNIIIYPPSSLPQACTGLIQIKIQPHFSNTRVSISDFRRILFK